MGVAVILVQSSKESNGDKADPSSPVGVVLKSSDFDLLLCSWMSQKIPGEQPLGYWDVCFVLAANP